MECSKSDELIMKYMDNAISEKEARMLNVHLSSCGKCMSDFKVYDAIMAEFSEMEIVETNADFEEIVMSKVQECGDLYSKRQKAAENIFTLILGIASVMFAAGFMFAINREQIIDYMAASSAFGSYASFMRPMLNLITQYSNSFINVVTNFSISAAGLIVDYKFAILLALVAILLVQYVYKRDKVGVK